MSRQAGRVWSGLRRQLYDCQVVYSPDGVTWTLVHNELTGMWNGFQQEYKLCQTLTVTTYKGTVGVDLLFEAACFAVLGRGTLLRYRARLEQLMQSAVVKTSCEGTFAVLGTSWDLQWGNEASQQSCAHMTYLHLWFTWLFKCLKDLALL